MRGLRLVTAATLAACASLAGCEPAPPDLSAEVPFEQSGPDWLNKELIPLRGDVAAPAPAEGGACAGVLDMLPKIESRMRTEVVPAPVLDAIDRCFERLGRGPDLVAFYLRARQAAPSDSRWIPRLAGAFVTLGDAAEAMRILATAPPDDPASLFLKGLVLASQAPSDVVAKRAARDAWRRLMEVDPEHNGLDSVPSTQIRARVRRWTLELGEGTPAATSAPLRAVPGAPALSPPTAGAAATSRPVTTLRPTRPGPVVVPSAVPAPTADALYAKALFEATSAHSAGRTEAAQAAYGRALEHRPGDATALAGLENIKKKKPAGP